MSVSVAAIRTTAVVTLASVALAVMTVWLVLTDPVTVVDAINRRDLSSLFELITRVATQAFQSVARYL